MADDNGGRRESPDKTTRRGPHRLVNARTHALETFSSRVPPYAILSHTWGSEEVSLQEWQAGTKTDCEGYHKVLGTCERAVLDGLDYVWVDTCCIDKTNHVELSEAINSMFKWYQDAEVCYVLLSDLEVHLHPVEQSEDETEDSNDTHSMSDNETKEFQRSRYFTRGWTLQEMLAARTVLFFAADGTHLGDLRRLAEIVSDATGIDVALLSGVKSLDDFTIPQKISWASNRKTTKVEDRTYSLLGLLNVSLDLRYGDGEQEFIRLQKEVLKQAHGIHVLAWMGTDGSRLQRLLADRPEDFRCCSGISFDRSVASGAEMWETNRGLRGALPVVRRSRSCGDNATQDLIVLDCYKAGSSDEVLALPVRRLGNSSGHVEFSVQSRQKRNVGSFPYHRLDKVTFVEYAEVRVENVSIMWDDKNGNESLELPRPGGESPAKPPDSTDDGAGSGYGLWQYQRQGPLQPDAHLGDFRIGPGHATSLPMSHGSGGGPQLSQRLESAQCAEDVHAAHALRAAGKVREPPPETPSSASEGDTEQTNESSSEPSDPEERGQHENEVPEGIGVAFAKETKQRKARQDVELSGSGAWVSEFLDSTEVQVDGVHQRHSCPECGKRFRRASDLNRHRRVHTPYEDRPFGCDRCDRRFLFAKDLKKHELVHRRRNLFCPEPDCEYLSFTRQDQVQRHMESRHGADTVREAQPRAISEWPLFSKIRPEDRGTVPSNTT